jgi:hypothetical protein
LECVKCLRVHGGGCPASGTDEDGTPVCIFHLDSLICPVQKRILASGTNVLERAAHIVQVKDPDGFEAHRSSLLNHSISIRALPIAGKSHQEDQQMSTTQKITPTPTSTAPPTRMCATPGCKKTLSYNNRTGICGECLAKKTKGIMEAKRAPAAAAADSAKPNGRLSHDPAHGNGNGNGKHNGNGNGAQPAEQPGLLVMQRVESRVDLLLAAVPRADKERLLSAWLAGTI